MRIQFTVPGMPYGGAERVISILGNAFVRQGHEVRILSFDKGGANVYHLDDAIEMVWLENMDGRRLGSVLSVLNKVRYHTKSFKPDVIISFINDVCAISAVATIGTGYPLIYSERNDPTFQNSSIKEQIFNRIIQWRARGFVFQTDGAKRQYPHKIQSRSEVILNPIRENSFPEVYEGEREKVIVTVGRLHPQKNHRLLLRSFADIADDYPEYSLRIYGDGQLRGELEALAGELGIADRTHFEGSVKDVLERIKSASVFAYTSDYEGLPNALIEAMVLGLPCISTDCSPGGAAMLIEDGVNGLLRPVGDAVQFADGLRYLLADPDKAMHIGKAARGLKERVAEQEIVEQWLEYIQKTIAER